MVVVVPNALVAQPIQDTPEQLFEDNPEPEEPPNDDHLTWEPLAAQRPAAQEGIRIEDPDE